MYPNGFSYLKASGVPWTPDPGGLPTTKPGPQIGALSCKAKGRGPGACRWVIGYNASLLE